MLGPYKSPTRVNMHFKSRFSVFAAALMFVSDIWAATTSPKGCFSSTTGLKLAESQTFNSIGSCSTLCLGKKAEAMAMQDSQCFCGSNLPPANSMTDDSKCSIPCPGYPDDLCGGVNAYSVYLTGLSAAVSNIDPSSASSSAPSTSKPPPTASIVTVGTGPTIIVTANPESSNSASSSPSSLSSSSSSSPNKAGIAAGVVVGLLAFGAIAGGLVIFLRNQKRRAIEEEHRQAAAVNSFIDGGKYSGPVTDTLLDPAVMANRRMSDGSIADNQDYSRRILK